MAETKRGAVLGAVLPGHPGSTAEGRGAVRGLWAASALGGLAQSLAGTAGALLARQVGGSDAVAGLPQALLVVGAAASALVLSSLTRRRGRGAALIAGAVAGVLGCLVVTAACLSGSLPGILLGSLLLGSGTTAVMLGRYAAADLAPETSRARAMASVLVATTTGAVAGPNLLAPSSTLAAGWGLPALVGPYLVAALGFAAAAGALAVSLGTGRPGPVAAASSTAPRLGRQGTVGLAALGVSNLVMVSVMTMAPVHLHHLGVGLGTVGLVVSVHIAGMFAPALVSGRLTDRYGPVPVVAGAGVALTLSCALAAGGAGSSTLVTIALLLLGIGWNLGLVAGSVLVTSDAPLRARPRREGLGEVAMGATAAGGGAASGVIVAAGGYPKLAMTAGSVAVLGVLILVAARVSVARLRRRQRRRLPLAELEHVAYRMFVRNVADDAIPAMVQLAWTDPDIRACWMAQAEAVAVDLSRRPRALSRRPADTQLSAPTDHATGSTTSTRGIAR